MLLWFCFHGAPSCAAILCSCANTPAVDRQLKFATASEVTYRRLQMVIVRRQLFSRQRPALAELLSTRPVRVRREVIDGLPPLAISLDKMRITSVVRHALRRCKRKIPNWQLVLWTSNL